MFLFAQSLLAVGVLSLVLGGCTPESAETDSNPDTADTGDTGAPADSGSAIDADQDGVPADDDCDDFNNTIGARSNDADCDGTASPDDCNDADATSTILAEDADCDTTPTAQDCDDANATSTTLAEDADCDATPTAQDCDDTDATSTILAEDADCNGIRDDEEAVTTWSGEYDLEDLGDVVLGDRTEDMAGRSFAAGTDLTGDGHLDLLVGARGADHGSDNNGAAYVVPGPISGERWLADETRLWKGLDGDSTGYAGATVAVTDLDADGQSDMVVGAYLSNGQRGAVYLVYGPITGGGELVDADVVWAGGYDSSNGNGAKLGYAVVGLGDVTGDGQADFAMSEPIGKSGTFSSAGNVYVLAGGESLPSNLAYAPTVISGAGSNGQAGDSLADAGDLDGDGTSDLVLYGELAARLFFGPLPSGATTDDADATFGSGLDTNLEFAGPGDVGGDGRGDLVIGTYGGGVGGEVYLFEAVVAGDRTISSADATWVHEQGGAAFGSSVGGAGDVNRDGFADVVMGAPADDEYGSGTGAAFLALGPMSGKHPVTDTEAVFFGEAPDSNAAQAVGGVGDLNGDGADDFAVSSMIGHDTDFWAGTLTILQ